MQSVMQVHIRAPYERIFPLAAEIERWPERLPHYRYVRRVPSANGERRFAMGARRGPIPVRWEAIQRPLPEQRRIEFTHTGGVTRGMEVAWRFEPRDGGWDVSIHHALQLHWPLVGGFAAERVIGPQFIDAIAGRTLRRVKALAEAPA
jgi:Polyketide cyclase / dehydrase and lipid transport